MLNYIWLTLVVAAVVLGGVTGRLQEVTEAAFESARTSVMGIALPLVGLWALWLGVMRLAEKADCIRLLARALHPVLRRLFPEVPPDHPALGSMMMNMAANMIGLTNAATPLGLRAMADLERLNPQPGTATNAMCTFLAINTSSVQLIPMTAISMLAVAGAPNPSAIVGTTLLATVCAVCVALLSVKTLEKLPWFRVVPAPGSADPRPASGESHNPSSGPPPLAPLAGWAWLVLIAFVGLFAVLLLSTVRHGAASAPSTSAFVGWMNGVSLLAVPFVLGFFPLYAALRGVRVYEEFVEGAKEGFQVAVRIIPYLVAMLVAVGTFRAAGGIEVMAQALRPVLDLIGFPAELLPMALTRPLSGSATIGLLGDLIRSAGADSLLAKMGGTLLGSTETTFYVLAVYFGAVGVKRARHAVAAGLLADLTGMIAAVVVCRMFFGG